MRNSVLLSLFAAACSFALPLTFEQRDPTHFLTRFTRGPVEIRPDRIVLHHVTLRFAGASRNARLEGLGPAAPSTYLRAGFSRTFEQYPKLAIRNLYPGVDAVFYGTADNLEYDLTIAPDASPDRIRILLEGARNVRIDDQGNVQIQTPSGELRQLRPHVFQHNREISTRYVLLARNEVGIRLGKHDRRSPLTIDPVLASVKSFGGSGISSATSIATDSQGNLYVAGVSNSVNFPTTSHAFDPHIAAPLRVLSNAGKTVAALNVATETNVGIVGGTSDGKILYASTANGIYVSGDSGSTWTQRAPFSFSSNGVLSLNAQFATVNSISLDPLDDATLLVATNYGLFGSGSGGEGWGLWNTGMATSASGFVSVYSAFFSPKNPLIAYAVTSNPSFVYASADAGNTWTQLNPTYPGEPAPPTDPFPQLDATLSPDGGTLYAIDGNGTLLKSTDGGATWTKLATGFFNPIAIQVDPNHSAAIYVLDYTGLHGSTDGGLTFSTVSVPPPAVGLAIDASGAVYVSGNGNTVYVSTDHGKTLTPVPQLMGRFVNSLTTLAGKAYVGTITTSVPFVVKLDASGSNILYSTFLGGSVYDTINGIAVDAQGSAVVVGSTTSPDFPLTIPAANPPTPNKSDAFIAKLNTDGTNLIYSTAFGGTQAASMQAVALDSSGAPYVAGSAQSGDFPTTAHSFQPAIPSTQCPRTPTSPFVYPNLGNYAFAAKLSVDGSTLEYSTFLTGSCGSFSEGIAVDSSGDAVVVGYTTSLDFPVSTAAYQSAFPPGVFDAGFVTKLNPTGTKVIASSYLGGGYSTTANAVTLDASGDAYLTGFTQGFAPGATPGAYQTKIVDRCTMFISIGPSPPYTGTGDAFVLKLDPTLSAAQFLTYLGGSCNDSGSSLALDAAGDVWVTGTTASPDFPLKDPFEIGGGDFVSELNPDASKLLFSSTSNGASLTITPQGVFLAVGNAIQAVLLGNTNASVAKIDPTITPTVEIDSVGPLIAFPPPTVNPGAITVAPGLLIQISGSNLGPATKVSAQVDATGRLPFILGGTIVYFGDYPAPLVSVDAPTILCYVPFEVTTATEVTVMTDGQKSNAVTMGVLPSVPQILSILNQDGTLNSAQHPAKLSSVITLYVSGLGQTNPPSDDGLTNSPPLPVPVVQVTVFLPTTTSGSVIVPQFVGAAPGLIAGITQINVQVPENTILVTGSTTTIGINSASAPLYVTK